MASVTLHPGDDIQAAIDANPAGTTFVLTAGTYRQAELVPKDAQQFIGEDGAVLNGAEVLTDWHRDGNVWAVGNLPDPMYHIGETADGTELAQFREDLFIDDQVYKRVGSMDDLGPGKWYFADNTAYITDDPTGRQTELSLAHHAIGGNSQDVVLKNLTIEKYATLAQEGAIAGTGTHDWQLTDLDVRFNHGVGLMLGDGMTVEGGSYSHNGQLGISGNIDGSGGAVIADAEVAYNNYAGFSMVWESGGIKLMQNKDITVRNCDIHDNDGNGIWLDTDIINMVIDGNRIADNTNNGIQYEASFDGEIRNNLVANSGKGVGDVWFWGADIMVNSSSNVHIHDNTAVVNADYGNGISLVNSGDAREGPYGQEITDGCVVENNNVIHLGAHGFNGIGSDESYPADYPGLQVHNVFQDNIYVVPDNAGDHVFWEFDGRQWTADAAVNDKPEPNGTYILSGDPGSYVPADGTGGSGGGDVGNTGGGGDTGGTAGGGDGGGLPGAADPFTVTVTAAGDGYKGAPEMRVYVDDRLIGDVDVTTQHKVGEWHDFTFTLDGVAHADTVTVAFANDAYGGSPGKDRNLWVQHVEVNHVDLQPQDATYDVDGGGSRPGQSGLRWTGALVFDVSGYPASGSGAASIQGEAGGDIGHLLPGQPAASELLLS